MEVLRSSLFFTLSYTLQEYASTGQKQIAIKGNPQPDDDRQESETFFS